MRFWKEVAMARSLALSLMTLIVLTIMFVMSSGAEATDVAETWQWPRDNAYIVSNDYSAKHEDGVRKHTGIDVHESSSRINGSVYAIADGEIIGIFRPTDETGHLCNADCVKAYTNYDYHHNGTNFRKFNGEIIRDHVMQGVVIIRHLLPVGGSIYNEGTLYSLYAHLDSVGHSISIGQKISRGTKLGNSGGGNNRHVHLEIKKQPYRHNPEGGNACLYSGHYGPCWGYVPGNPDDYGYWDPWIFIHTIDSVSPNQGPAANQVSINGSMFNRLSDAENCKLYFGRSQASVSSYEDSQIIAIAPAENGKVHVSFKPTRFFQNQYLPSGVKNWITYSYYELEYLSARKLESGDNLIHGFTYAYGYLWASTRTYPTRILRIDPVTLNYHRLTMPSGYNAAEDLIAFGNFIWAITYTNPARIIRINPNSLTWDEPVKFARGEFSYGGSLEYAFGYLWAGGEYGTLARIDLSNMSYILYNYQELSNQIHALASGGNYIWATSFWDSSVVRINPVNPDNRTVLKHPDFFISDDIIFTGGHLFAASENVPYKLFKFASDLSYKSVELPSGSYGVFSVGEEIWSTNIGSPGKILRFDQDLNLLGEHLLPSGYSHANELAFDPKHGDVFVTSWQSPAGIVKYRYSVTVSPPVKHTIVLPGVLMLLLDDDE